MSTAVMLADEQVRIETVYRAESERLWRAVHAYCGDHDIASDAVAEAFVQVARRGAAVRDPAAWTWRAAFRIAAGSLKARGRMADLESRPEAQADNYADADLLRALQQLPERQRAVVVLFYYVDLPVNEIARRLGSNSLAVRAHLSRGRRRLRELLGEDDG
jgi:RNA polymerase sigma-70 factor (ECF subfamily)